MTRPTRTLYMVVYHGLKPRPGFADGLPASVMESAEGYDFFETRQAAEARLRYILRRKRIVPGSGDPYAHHRRLEQLFSIVAVEVPEPLAESE